LRKLVRCCVQHVELFTREIEIHKQCCGFRGFTSSKSALNSLNRRRRPVENGLYDDLGYGTELDPPLAGEDAAWVEALLKAAGRR